MADAITLATDTVLKEIISALKSKAPVKENYLELSNHHQEMFKVRVASPEVLVIKLKEPGFINVQLKRSASAIPTAHMEGILSHLGVNGSKKYSRSYRSDGSGLKTELTVFNGETLVITLEAHHFCSAVFGHGSTEMDIVIEYTKVRNS